MPKEITITVTTKVVTANGLSNADTEAFEHFFGSCRTEIVSATDDASGLLPKEAKELAAFREFVRRPEFPRTIQKLLGTKPASVLRVELLSGGEDPPDLRLKLAGNALAIEVTDFPPDQEAMAKAARKVQRAGPLPTYHESGCSPEFIEEFVRAGFSQTRPHASDLGLEVLALDARADLVLRKKDQVGKSELLLLDGRQAFEYPENEVLKTVVSRLVFSHLRAIVFLTPNRANVHWTNRA